MLKKSSFPKLIIDSSYIKKFGKKLIERVKMVKRYVILDKQ